MVECSQTVEPMACRRNGNWPQIVVQLFLHRSAAWFAPALELATDLGGKKPARFVRVTTVLTSLMYDDVVWSRGRDTSLKSGNTGGAVRLLT